MKRIPSLIVGGLALAVWLGGTIHGQPAQAPSELNREDTSDRIAPPSRDDEPASGSIPATSATAPQKSARESSRHRSSHDRIAVLNGLVVREGETTRDTIVVGGTAKIDGFVDGDLVLVFSKARLGPGVEVKGSLVAVGTELEASPDLKVGGDHILVGITGTGVPGEPWLKWPQQWLSSGLLHGRPLAPAYAWSWAVAGLTILICLLVTLLFPKQVQLSAETVGSQPGKSFVFGLLALALVLPAVILLVVTVVGIFLLPFVGCVAVVVFLLGKTVVYSYAGQQLGLYFRWPVLQSPVAALLAGGLLFCLLYLIPIVGLLLWLLVLPLGIGGVIQTMATGSRRQSDGTTTPPAVPVAIPSAIPGEPPTQLVQLPRAGFWVRLLATLLDLVLVGIVCGMLHWQRWFLLLWVVYHVSFWAWKSTTIGGILVGLKIVRTNGTPITLAVAVVRCLASFFSFAVLGLGFFWAGWTPEKQSWHDTIAGTLMIKLPKGTMAF